MKSRRIQLAVLMILTLAACQGETEMDSGAEPSPVESAPPVAMTQWINLFDGSSLDGWRRLGDANWQIMDDYVEATSGRGFLVTPAAYGDFHLKLEFWTDPDANSGVFIRCSDPDAVSSTTAYEVNIFDKRPDPVYRTGAIVRVASPMAQIDAANQWNTYEIKAQGSRLTVTLNGTLTVDVEDSEFASGPFALQYAAGIVRFRNIQIMEL